MFVYVTKDGRTFHKVSETIFEKKMKKKGYYISEHMNNMKKETEEPVNDVSYEDKEEVKEKAPEEVQEETEENEMEVLVSDMNKEQLAEFAKMHNIDTSSASNVRQARAIIKAAIANGRK